MKRTLTATVAGLALAIVGGAQAPPGITPDMISRALPLEGAPLAVPGPYEVASGPAFGSPGHVVFHPADLDAFPAEDSLPVMAWGNGGCAINGTRYSGFLTTIASHGFLVLSTAPVAGAGRGRAGGGRPWSGARLGRGRERTGRRAVRGQDRDRPDGGHGPVLRGLSLRQSRRRPSSRHDRAVQFGRFGRGTRRRGRWRVG